MKNGKITKVTIHVTATPKETTVEQIRKAHKSQGWSDIGYHWLVDYMGNIHEGRDEEFVGAHVGGYNTNNIGISGITRGSDSESNAPYGKFFTTEQMRGLEEITADVLFRHNLEVSNVYGHNDFTNAKACPCFKVRGESGKVFRENVQRLLDIKRGKIVETPKEKLIGVLGYDFRAVPKTEGYDIFAIDGTWLGLIPTSSVFYKAIEDYQ